MDPDARDCPADDPAAAGDAGQDRGASADRRLARDVDEELAVNLGLLFRALAPMRNREYMAAVATGIEAMAREEAGYWLGMAMHRKYPRRVLMALRILLIDPNA